jgi:hypothetical protein
MSLTGSYQYSFCIKSDTVVYETDDYLTWNEMDNFSTANDNNFDAIYTSLDFGITRKEFDILLKYFMCKMTKEICSCAHYL